MADTVWEAYAKEKERLIELLKDSPSLDALDDYGYAMGADHLIANGVTVTDNNVGGKWIPVTERLPENEKVIVVLGNPCEVWTFNGDYWEDEYGWLQEFKGVTHWMPLPEPPKGE